MFWIDGYSELYQRANGFPITVLSKPDNKKAYLSFKPTTRAAYDLSMRESTIDGLITMDNIESELNSGSLFHLDAEPGLDYLIQTLSLWEQQPNTRNINAVRLNCYVTVQRFGYKDEEATEEEWYDVYTDVKSYISETLKDGKNFSAGLEVNTLKILQIPKVDEDGNIREVHEGDRYVVKTLKGDDLFIKINGESVDSLGASGIIRVQGTQDTRVNG